MLTAFAGAGACDGVALDPADETRLALRRRGARRRAGVERRWDAHWCTRAEVAAAAAGRGEVHVPPPPAIARRLIDGWLGQ